MMADGSHDLRPRPYPLAALYGALVPMVIGALVLNGWVLVGQLQNGQPIAPLESIPLFLAFLTQAAIVAFPTAYLLIGIMALIEARKPKPLLLWLALSLVATTPAAAIGWLVGHMGDCFRDCRPLSEWQLSAPALIIYACGLLGAVIARRTRYGSWI